MGVRSALNCLGVGYQRDTIRAPKIIVSLCMVPRGDALQNSLRRKRAFASPPEPHQLWRGLMVEQIFALAAAKGHHTSPRTKNFSCCWGRICWGFWQGKSGNLHNSLGDPQNPILWVPVVFSSTVSEAIQKWAGVYTSFFCLLLLDVFYMKGRGLFENMLRLYYGFP